MVGHGGIPPYPPLCFGVPPATANISRWNWNKTPKNNPKTDKKPLNIVFLKHFYRKKDNKPGADQGGNGWKIDLMENGNNERRL